MEDSSQCWEFGEGVERWLLPRSSTPPLAQMQLKAAAVQDTNFMSLQCVFKQI